MKMQRRATFVLGAIALMLMASALHCLEVATPPPKAADDGSTPEAAAETLEVGNAADALGDGSTETAADSMAAPDTAPDTVVDTVVDAPSADADVSEAAKDASRDGDAEFCPDPRYPLRTDGCPGRLDAQLQRLADALL